MAESSSSKVNVDKKDPGVDEDAQGITMLDVLQEEKELEDDVKAVLGAADDKNCTYSKGYVKRQALYACVTCTPQWKSDIKPGGVCLACSYHCHEGHELIELYTKRNFRCDCGNGKFPGRKCNLEPNKADVNEQNMYNQNFCGVYCTCQRPYPDPEDESGDIMVQCIICEDWYHERHLGKPLPPQQDYEEVICAHCMKQHNYLIHYAMIDIMTDGEASGNCVLKDKVHESDPGTIYFPEGWRKKLCCCNTCKKLYETQGVGFLVDEQDTVLAYEEKGKASGESQYEQGMRALSSMNRVQQVEAIEEYNDMKNQLKEYLQKFAENKKVVREEDIREFFSGMEARKKQRPGIHVPYFCN